MALFDNGFKMGGSLVVGAGVILLAPIVVPVVASLMKPIAKAAIKGGLLAYGKIKETAAETMETVEDLAVEAKAELADSTQKTAKTKKAAAAAK
jgi:Protein of unknown function (DUF5132)